MKTIYRNAFKTSKVFNDGGKKRIDVTIRIDDQCGNGHCDFSITANVYELNCTRWINTMGGCCHDEILKVFPEFADFVSLHLSNVHGQPMYAESNGHYLLTKYGAKECAKYLRIDEQTAQMLSGDKAFFKYQLFALGIVDKWQEEADKAIKHFEELKGEKWVNPYTPNEERLVLKLTEDERVEIENLIASGYYDLERIKEREDKAKRGKWEKERHKIVEMYDNKIREAELEKAVYLCVFDTLGTTDNVIYYSHSNTLCFNWMSYGEKWTQEQFCDFVNSVDKSRLPENINFEIK